MPTEAPGKVQYAFSLTMIRSMDEISHPRRPLAVETAQNVRDLGGYTTHDGRMTQWHRLIRAGDMERLSGVDQRRLIDHGIDAIIDLRMQREVTSLPNVFQRSAEVTWYNHDFWGDRFDDYRSTRRGASPEVKLADLYCAGLVASGFVVKDIMTTIADSGHRGFAFHCRSGKDRTGIVAALLLAIAGVPNETIIADYALTSKFLDTPNAKRVKPGQPGAYLHGCAPQTMALTLDFIDQQYGGVQDYLSSVGVQPQHMGRIRTLLLEER
jgi:protein-tyrosine phosphatase